MASKDYTYSFRLQIVQEALKPENRNSISYIAQKYGVSSKVLERWIKRYNEYGTDGLKPNWKTRVKDQRIKELERENAKLREEAEILLIIMLLIGCMLITACSDKEEETPPEVEPHETASTLEAWDFSFELPEYYGEPSVADEKGYRYDIGNEAVIDLTATDIPDMDSRIYGFESQRESTPERPVLNTEDITVADMKGIVQTLDIYEDADERAWFLVDEENKRIFLFTVMQNDETRTRDYIADFEKVLASMKHIGGGNSAQETSEDTVYAAGDWKSAYADVLKAHEEKIRSYDWQVDINGNELLNNVLLYDLTGDGSSDLKFMDGGRLHIYHYMDGKAAECEYDVVPVVPYIDDNKAAFGFIPAGGGANYMIYSGKDPGTFYAAHNIWNTSMSSSSIKYTVSDTGLVKAEACVHNASNNDPNDLPRDDYEINGEPVSSKKGTAMFREHRADYGDLLMYNMKCGSLEKVKDFKVFEHLKTDKPLAGSYDEVMKELSE